MKILTKVKEIRSRTGELHFQRFAILETCIFSIYIHKIFKEDKDPHLHSHPWNFWTMILKGSYVEKFLGKDLFLDNQHLYRKRGMFSIVRADRNYFHKILEITSGPIYTLFVAFGKRQDWHYLVNEQKIESNSYRELKREGKLPK